jgi:hypothetical protein
LGLRLESHWAVCKPTAVQGFNALHLLSQSIPAIKKIAQIHDVGKWILEWENPATSVCWCPSAGRTLTILFVLVFRETTIMTVKQWTIVLAVGLILTYAFHFGWFKDYEHVALWLEAAALIFIFGLDFFERRAQEEERKLENARTIRQLEISQRQLEAMHRPCLTVPATQRDMQNVHLKLSGSDSTQILGDIRGGLGVLNVGSGHAFNVSYTVIVDEGPGSASTESGTIFHVFLKEPEMLAPEISRLRGRAARIILEYESISGQRYRSRIEMRDYVLIGVKHEELGPPISAPLQPASSP